MRRAISTARLTTAAPTASVRCTASRVTPPANGRQTVIHNFTGLTDGYQPNSLAIDAAGNLFGATSAGGSSSFTTQGYGIVFELSRAANGSWTLTVLHAFAGQFADGYTPGGVATRLRRQCVRRCLRRHQQHQRLLGVSADLSSASSIPAADGPNTPSTNSKASKTARCRAPLSPSIRLAIFMA